jgi:hypothetical protein
MPITMTQLSSANDSDLENLCRTALSELFEMGLKNKGHAEQHIVNAASTLSMSVSAKQRGAGSSVVGNTHLFKANFEREKRNAMQNSFFVSMDDAVKALQIVLKSSEWQVAYNPANKLTVVEVPATQDAKHRVAFYKTFAEGEDANVSAGQHRVTKMESTAQIHAEIGVDVGDRVHIHTLYPKA